MHVIVTMGSKGALIHNDNDSRIVEGFKVEAVDTTAAGDSFNGALISAYLESHDFMEAVRYANAFAALSVYHKTAGFAGGWPRFLPECAK